MKFADLINPPTPVLPPPTVPTAEVDADHARRYALAALQRENDILANTHEGGRNHQLNTSAFSCAQLIPHITEAEIRATLGGTAHTIGLTTSEIRATLASGIQAGSKQPRTIPDPPPANVHVLPTAADLIQQDTGQVSRIDAFWSARPVLQHIHDFARARMSAPWAVLGGCLLRAVACVPHTVVTPALIGNYGTLNLFVAAVGPSGAGKGASEGAAAAALTWPHIHTAPLGSGEGIAHAYARRNTKRRTEDDPDPEPLVWENRSVLFSASEIDQVAAIGSRQGSTLMSQLRQAYSGENLGMQYADASRRIILPPRSYRFTLSVGVQPDRAQAFLNEDEAAGGTPQRFIWLPVTDPSLELTEGDGPSPMVWRNPLQSPARASGVESNLYGGFVLPVPDEVSRTIRMAHVARMRGDGDALDGHALYTRLKVAHALAFLDERPIVSLEDWELAGTVMLVSDLTRQRVQARLQVLAAEAVEQRARREARHQVIVEDTVSERKLLRVVNNLGRRLADAGEMPWAELRRALASRDRDVFEDAVGRLVSDGLAEVIEGDGRLARWVG